MVSAAAPILLLSTGADPIAYAEAAATAAAAVLLWLPESNRYFRRERLKRRERIPKHPQQ